MKLAFISDIHGNLAALEAVLNCLSEEGCFKTLCAGDIVGYGPDPKACIQLIRERDIPCVKGNHDEWAVHGRGSFGMSRDARISLSWTHRELDRDERNWLANLPMHYSYAGITVVHASHAVYPRWPYVVTARQMLNNFVFQRTALSVCGHTHKPLLVSHSHGERVKAAEFTGTKLPAHCRCLINAGSVGQPRDGDPRATACLMDVKEKSVEWLRCEYDVSATQKRIDEAELPAALAERLAKGR